MRSKGDPTKSPARGQYHPCSISPISCGTLLSLHSPRKIPLHAFITLASTRCPTVSLGYLLRTGDGPGCSQAMSSSPHIRPPLASLSLSSCAQVAAAAHRRCPPPYTLDCRLPRCPVLATSAPLSSCAQVVAAAHRHCPPPYTSDCRSPPSPCAWRG